MVQTVAACRTARTLFGAQQEEPHPEWLRDSRTPVLVGGFAAVIIAYCISMYTIYHVARAYKKLELKVCDTDLSPLSTVLPGELCLAGACCAALRLWLQQIE